MKDLTIRSPTKTLPLSGMFLMPPEQCRTFYSQKTVRGSLSVYFKCYHFDFLSLPCTQHGLGFLMWSCEMEMISRRNNLQE